MDPRIAANVTPTTKDPDHSEMLDKHLKALDRKNIFDPIIRETGVIHTAKQTEARRQERLQRGNGRRAVIARSANPWPASGSNGLNAMATESLSEMAAIALPSLCRTGTFCRPR